MTFSLSEVLSRLAAAQLLAALCLSIILYQAIRGCYRLYFHPLSSFPGPRAAAISNRWLLRLSSTGRQEEQFERLHDQYAAAAIRIGPNELHINDVSLYKTIYSQSKPFPKHKDFYDGFNTPHTSFTEDDFTLHKARRRLLNPYFSHIGVVKIETTMRQHIANLQAKMEELSARDLPIMSYNAFRCVTVDIITEFAFAKSRNLITSSDDQFSNDFLAAFDATAELIWNAILSPAGRKIGNLLPESLVKVISPQVVLILGMVDHATISYKDYKRSVPVAGKPVIFDSLQDLPDKLVISEAVNILIAGSDTTAWTLNIGVQQILADEEHKQKLYSALREAYPSKPAELPGLTELEAIPYLTACIKESLRIAMPVRGRLPRVVPSSTSGHYNPLVVNGGTIVPPDTVVGMSAYTMHYSEALWGPDARTFNPDRWLGEHSKGLDAYLCTFSKGARSCIGQNLAMAELYLMFYMLFQNFEMEVEGLRKIASPRDLFTSAPDDGPSPVLKVRKLQE